MSRVEQVADAILYEGYILYPYRPSSVKNRQRWTYGGVYPRAWSEASGGTDAWEMRTECLVTAGPRTSLSVRVRFLHLLERLVGELTPPLTAWPAVGEPGFRPVPLLRIADRSYLAWQEATERQVHAEAVATAELLGGVKRLPFRFAASQQMEPVAGSDGTFVGVLLREHEAVEGEVELSARPVEDGLLRLAVVVRNLTALQEPGERRGSSPPSSATADDREWAQRHALISTHTILHVCEGAFVSLIDPPPGWKAHAQACRNVGTWPVLAGAEGSTDTVLSSPIILYDYPRVAAESAGDLFDSTEIDEILTLRILTLTDEEKRELSAADERVRLLLERTEALAAEQMRGMHGALRRREDDG